MPKYSWAQWTQDEDDIIRAGYPQCSIRELSQKIPRHTYNAIKARASKLGLFHFKHSRAGPNKEWLDIRKQILKRDNYHCQDCDMPQNEVYRLDVHHNDGNADNNDFTNLVTLCPSCHHARHYHGMLDGGIKDKDFQEFKEKVEVFIVNDFVCLKTKVARQEGILYVILTILGIILAKVLGAW